MKVIYKYQIENLGPSYLDLPIGAEIISVINQRDTMVVYAMLDPKVESFWRYQFYVIGTGHFFTDEIEDYTFLGTVPVMEATFVWHVFYKSVGPVATKGAE